SFWSSSRETTRMTSAWSTPEMKVFCPEITHSSPERRAVVVILWELEPASGSVMANAAVISPDAMPGSHVRFCSSVPNLERMLPLIAGETTIMSRPAPAADSSSSTRASSYMPAPPPPYSSGMLTPSRPSFPASAHSSLVVSPASDFSRAYSKPSREPSECATSRRAFCSSVSTRWRTASVSVVVMGSLLGIGVGGGGGVGGVGLGDDGEDRARGDLVPHRDGQFGDHAVSHRGDRVFHLHGLHPQQRAAGGPGAPHLDRDADDGARPGREERARRHRGGRIRVAGGLE